MKDENSEEGDKENDGEDEWSCYKTREEMWYWLKGLKKDIEGKGELLVDWTLARDGAALM